MENTNIQISSNSEQANLSAEQAGSQLATVKIFPNPTSDILNIVTSQPTLIQIFNTNGQMVKEQSIQNSQTISIENLPIGIYYIKIGNQTQKLIKK